MVIKEEEIVITGVSCRMPESDNMDEFKENLMNKVDMITEDDRRWIPGYYNLPKRHGKVKDLKKFDAAFFSINPKQVNMMDPQLRILLEVAYEAILDAGINPQNLRGTRTGVFVGCSSAETQDVLIQDPDKTQGYSLTGCQKSMFANRLSFSFDFKGPSFAVDTACSSSLLAFQLAVDAIKHGTCDAALVCGTQLTLRPTSAMQFFKLGMLSPQGKCQTFDAKGDGYVRSEGIAAVLLQKDSDAHRIYAEVVHAKSNTDGFKEQGITYPNGNQQALLLKEIYTEAGVDPNDVVYVECHGTGTKVGDPQEANAIARVFCENRNTPLLIGSVKSNMGHAEPASGLASVCKLLIAAQSGYIAPNLHYTEPNAEIPTLIDNRMKVVTEKTEIEGGYVGINSFGFGGANTHVILKLPFKQTSVPKTEKVSVPKIFAYGGRTKEAVDTAFTFFQGNNFDDNIYALMTENSLQSASTYPYRGYLVYNRENNLPPLKEIQKISTNEQRPVWFIYSGMGTHYAGMGRELLQIKIFNETVCKCSSILEPYGIKIFELISNGGSDGVWCAVCICAIQVALTETLKFLNIQADGIVGHSFGEMAAAYCDGCMTLEETMLCAYYRTKSILEGSFPPGAMAAVGMTWEEAKVKCPEGVVTACHNAKDSVTISGEKEKISEFVEQLQKEGIFAKEVNSAGIAFHSHYMRTVAPIMKKYLSKIITEPKQRSSKWISSSVPSDKWSTPLGMKCSADYHVNNAVSPVLFYEAMQYVPENSVLIEISPHCLLQAILRRCLSSTCTNVGLLKANHENNLEFFMQNLGKIYEAGLPIKLQNLYPSVRFPVARATPMISPMMKWDHSQDWFVISMDDMKAGSGASAVASNSVTVEPFAKDSEDKFLLDHVIDGRALFPFAGHVVLAWQTICKLHGFDFQKTPIVIDDMTVQKATILSQQPIKFNVNISSATGTFEILENDQVTASGKITIPENSAVKNVVARSSSVAVDNFVLTGNEVYKELRLRGYEYGPTFQPIVQASEDGRRTQIEWTGNWVPFIDAMLQAILLAETGETMKLPVRIRYLSIEPEKHITCVEKNKNDISIVNTITNPALNQCVAGGIVLRDLVAQSVARRSLTNGKLVLEKVNFVNYFDDQCLIDYPEYRNEINEYEHLCRSSVHNLVKKFVDAGVQLPNAAILKEITNGAPVVKTDFDGAKRFLNNNDCFLLQTLKEIQEVNMADKKNMKILSEVLKRFQNLDQDQLWRLPYHYRVIKPLLDVVIENTTGYRLNCCCLEPESCLPVKLCQDLQSTQPLIEVNWTLVGPNVDQLDESQITQSAVATKKFDLDSSSTKFEEGQQFDLILLDKVLHRKSDLSLYLKNIKELLRDDGFLLVNEVTQSFEIMLAVHALQGRTFSPQNDARKFGLFYDNENWMKIFQKSGFSVVARQGHELMTTTYLLRKKPDVVDSADKLLVKLNDTTEFSWLKPVQDAVERDQKVWLTCDNGYETGAVGFGLCLKAECSKNIVRTIVNVSLTEERKCFDVVELDLQKILSTDLHSNIYRQGCWGSFRHIPIREDQTATTVDTEHAFINTLVPGDLNSLSWVESPNKFWQPSSDKKLCNVNYAALNFRDIMLATGRLSGDAIPGDFVDRDCLLGMEYSGRWSDSGERIMGLAAAQALATTVVAHERFTWSVPNHWTLEEAATVPVAYCTAYYSLIVRGRIKPGDKVLIHGGSGGVGQAAIAVALAQRCEVFTTTSSEEKKNYLQKRFPRLTDRNFSTSRSSDFEQDILQETEGVGVDVVLNSLSEEKLQASVRCLAQHGRFLEIGKFDLAKNSNLGMSIFLKNITFHGILLDALFGENNTDWLEVRKLFEEGIRTGVVQPLHTTVFSNDKITEAFRYMAQGKHIGKVLLNIHNEEQQPVNSTERNFTVRAVCRTLCHPEHSFIITGGLGGFGLELTKWLIKRGARNIVSTSRTGVKNGYQSRCLKSWMKSGVKVVVSTADISCENGAEQLVKEAQKLGPVGGVFHLAMVLRDNLFENLTPDAFKESAEAKHSGTKFLDTVTRRVCGDELKYFVVFSSISCGRGNAGQTNYGWSNSIMERIIEKRRFDGFPGMAIQWGAIGDVGVVLETMGDNSTVVGGTMPQRIPSCMQILDAYLNLQHPIVSSFVKADVSTLSKNDSECNKDPVQAVAIILGVSDMTQIDHDAQLGDLGLDSLMGVEIKQTLERNFSLVLSAKEIRTLTLNKLGKMTERSK